MKNVKLPILLVDDEEQNLDFMVRHLKTQFDHDIVCFSNPTEALEWAKGNQALVGLIDYRMPTVSGLELVKHIRALEAYQETPMVMVTAETSRALIPEIFDAGFMDYVYKPLDRNELCARVKNAIDAYEAKQVLNHEKERLEALVHEAERTIQDRDMRFRLAVEAAENGIWDFDLKSNDLFLSPNWFTMIGYTEDEGHQSLEFWISRILDQDEHIFESALQRIIDGKEKMIECTYRMVHKKGHHIWVSTKGKLQCDEYDRPCRIIGAQCDITDLKTEYKQLAYNALHDSLTGLPNRALLEERLQQAFLRYKRSPESPFSVVFLDLDNFKDINDTYGHGAGDKLLIDVSCVLEKSARDIDTVARFGGDEFVLLLEHTLSDDDVYSVTKRIYDMLEQSFVVGGQRIKLDVSMGAVTINSAYDNDAQILKDADVALYQAKETGRNKLVFYDHSMNNIDPRKKILLESLEGSLKHNEMEIYYQPIVCFRTEKVTGFEALLRWHHPKMGVISPVDFIPLAERNDMILKLSDFVMKGALQQSAQWQKKMDDLDLLMCINVVADQVTQAGFLGDLQKECVIHDIRPETVVLEFSEYCLSQVFKWDSLFLNEVKEAGFNIALDDYGESRASIRSLIDYRMNVLKVDRSLTLEVLHDERKRRLFDLMIHLGRETDLKVVVEGIQNQDILNYVRRSRAEYGQGFLFAKPIPAKDVEKFLKNHEKSLAKKVS